MGNDLIKAMPTMLSKLPKQTCYFIFQKKTMLSTIAVFSVFLLNFLDTTHSATIKTKLGYIEGAEGDWQGKGLVYSFLKIPYGKPPTGNMRFRKPEPYGAWSSTLNAKSFGPMCVQPYPSGAMESEDCLHLNIFIPRGITPATPRSVMVWIHGGAYLGESAVVYDGSDFVLSGDVILVIINYRLGALGFLATDDGSIPGNYGLWDQHLALQWVHDNIADYGGDPDSVTIFGESAGGGSVSFQSLYPGNEGLFQRAISQSGVATSIFLRRTAPSDSTKAQVKDYFKSMNCPSENVTQVLECLRQLPSSAYQSMYSLSGPTIDMDFVHGNAEDVLKNKSSAAYKFFTSLDYMVGALSGDGLPAMGEFLLPQALSQYNTTMQNGLPTEVLCQVLVPGLASYIPSSSGDLCSIYTESSSLQAQSNAVVDLMTDFAFFVPAVETAEYHYRNVESNASTFVYLMTVVNPLQYTAFPYWTPPWAQRATHVMDVLYLFNTGYGATAMNKSADLTLVNTMRDYWANFAKTGYVYLYLISIC